MPELPVDAEKERKKAIIGLYLMALRMKLDHAKWAEAEVVGLDALKLKWEIDPQLGMSRITDLKVKFEGLDALLKLIIAAAKAANVSEKLLPISLLRSMHTEYKNALRDEYGIEIEEEPNVDTGNTDERRLKMIELDRLRKKKVAGEAKGHEMPVTTKKIARYEAELNQPTKDTGNMSGKDVAAAVVVQNVEVVRHGDKLMIPVNLDIQDAIKLLQARARYEEEIATIIETYDVFPWDGAIALARVLQARFGWVPQDGASVMVDSGIDERVAVPWGEFKVPGIDGKMQCDTARKEGRVIFQVHAFVKHKHEHIIKDILKEVLAELKVSSIYRGKAIKVRFLDDQGRILAMPEPKFIDVMNIDENAVAYAKPVQDAIETNLFTPIRRVRELEANGLPIKRSVMLGGVYGTGKTLAAGVAAKLAVQQGMTYIYVSRADELTHALAFSRPYQDPAVMLFCEDLDRAMSGERTVKIDDILNTIDGVDTRNDRRMLVFTTNDIEAIEPAMIRPGRLDAVIEVTPPDAKAAWKLVQIYGGKTLASDVDGEAVGKALENQIPAVIAEVVRRSKLSQLKITPIGQLVKSITTQALLDASQTMVRQLELLNRGEDEYMPLEQALAVVGSHLGTMGGTENMEPLPEALKLLMKVKKVA